MPGTSEVTEGLPPDTSEYVYPGSQEKLEEIMFQEGKRFKEGHMSQFVVFTDISSYQFDQFQEFPGRLDYVPNTLVLKMPTTPHETFIHRFEALVSFKARDMGVWRLIGPFGASTQRTSRRGKEPDLSFGPRTLRGHPREWPTVAVEIGYSESREKLMRDVSFWLNTSKREVLTVISIDIKRPSGNITVAAWEAGATATRKHPNPAPRAVHQMKITRQGNSHAPAVTGDDITIPFFNLLLRQPRPHSAEGNFVFTRAEVLEIAEEVWDEMRNCGHLKD